MTAIDNFFKYGKNYVLLSIIAGIFIAGIANGGNTSNTAYAAENDTARIASATITEVIVQRDLIADTVPVNVTVDDQAGE